MSPEAEKRAKEIANFVADEVVKRAPFPTPEQVVWIALHVVCGLIADDRDRMDRLETRLEKVEARAAQTKGDELEDRIWLGYAWGRIDALEARLNAAPAAARPSVPWRGR